MYGIETLFLGRMECACKIHSGGKESKGAPKKKKRVTYTTARLSLKSNELMIIYVYSEEGLF